MVVIKTKKKYGDSFMKIAIGNSLFFFFWKKALLKCKSQKLFCFWWLITTLKVVKEMNAMLKISKVNFNKIGSKLKKIHGSKL